MTRPLMMKNTSTDARSGSTQGVSTASAAPAGVSGAMIQAWLITVATAASPRSAWIEATTVVSVAAGAAAEYEGALACVIQRSLGRRSQKLCAQWMYVTLSHATVTKYLKVNP